MNASGSRLSSVAVAAWRTVSLGSAPRVTTDSSSSSFESGSSPRAAASFIASSAAPDLMASIILLGMALLFGCKSSCVRADGIGFVADPDYDTGGGCSIVSCRMLALTADPLSSTSGDSRISMTSLAGSPGGRGRGMEYGVRATCLFIRPRSERNSLTSPYA